MYANGNETSFVGAIGPTVDLGFRMEERGEERGWQARGETRQRQRDNERGVATAQAGC